jgi:hypothetical protein
VLLSNLVFELTCIFPHLPEDGSVDAETGWRYINDNQIYKNQSILFGCILIPVNNYIIHAQ